MIEALNIFERANRALKEAENLSYKSKLSIEQLEVSASTCTLCELHKGRVTPVFSKGNESSGIFVCGMVPADEENKAGVPFVGRAGQLLDKLLIDSGLSSDSVYITNLVKCYLSAGLPLEQTWIDSCLPYLLSQIALLKPKVVVTLGKDAAVALLSINPKESLGKIRKQGVYESSAGYKIVPTYHPSYLLRGGGEKHKSYKDVVADFVAAREITLL